MSRSTATAAVQSTPTGEMTVPPAVDERLIAPHQRQEVLDGKLIYSPPAGEEHGSKHWQVPTLLGMLLAEGYAGAIDMLTRTSLLSDVAPDASIYPVARDPKTEGRQLEELAFEIRSEQALTLTTQKARALVGRGVRRVFLIDLKDDIVCEWNRRRKQWQELAKDASINDRCFRVPVPIAALLDRTRANEAVIEAILAREDHPKVKQARQQWEQVGYDKGLEQGLEQGIEKGREQELRRTIEDLCKLFGVKLTVARMTALDNATPQQLEDLRTRLLQTKRWG